MSAPWLKFFPTDWRADPALRMCSVGARGLWMEMLCVMHEAEPRGSLRINGKAVTDRQLASLAGCPDIAELMIELEEAGVFSREEDGTIFSRRMVRDAEKAEEDRANGKRGGNPSLKGGVNPPDKAQKPEAIAKEEPTGSSKKRPTQLPPDFVADIEWAIAQGLFPSEAQTEAAQFKDFWLTKSGKEALKADWPAAWRMWVRNYLKRRAQSPPSKPPKPLTVATMWREEARDFGILNDPPSQSDRRVETRFPSGDNSTPGFARRIASTGSG